MHQTVSHTTYARVSRRGLHDAGLSRFSASVEPCLHTTPNRSDAIRD